MRRCVPDIVLFIGLEGIAVCDHAASSQAAAGGSVLNASKASNTAQVSTAPGTRSFPPTKPVEKSRRRALVPVEESPVKNSRYSALADKSRSEAAGREARLGGLAPAA